MMYQQLLDLLRAQQTDEIVHRINEFSDKREDIEKAIKDDPSKLVAICQAYMHLIPAASKNEILQEGLSTVIDICGRNFSNHTKHKKELTKNVKYRSSVLGITQVVFQTFDNTLVKCFSTILDPDNMLWKLYSDEEKKETLKIIAENIHKLDRLPDETEEMKARRKAAHNCVSEAPAKILSTLPKTASLDDETKDIIAKLCEVCADRILLDPLDQEDDEEDGNHPIRNGFTQMLYHITRGPCDKNVDLCVVILPSLRAVSSVVNKYLSGTVSRCILLVSKERPDLLNSDAVQEAVNSYTQNPAADKKDATPNLLEKLYPNDPDTVHRNLEPMAAVMAMPAIEPFRCFHIIALIKLVVDRKPQVISVKILEILFDMTSPSRDPHMMYSLLVMDIVLAVCLYDSTKVSLSRLFTMAVNCPTYMFKSCELLRAFGTHDKTSQDDVMRIFSWLLKEQISNPTLVASRMFFLESAKAIGSKDETNKKCLMTFRAEIDQLNSEPVLTEYTEPIINLLEGRSLMAVSQTADKHDEQIATVTTDVEETKADLSNVKEEVAEQGEEIDKLGEEVKATQEEVKIIKTDLAEALIDIDRIDRKTVDTTPEWSHDVCKLLNPESDHDWRLLAKRLGYSNEEVKGWTSQSNPCMGMLNEWFATHKTYEAARAVYIMLKEMERQDAARIVEKAMKKAGELVPDDEPLDITHPPEVFISYQWGVQEKAKLIKDHLKSAGYSCWMDIGQMGGGDKLYEKIDTGIRNAKLVLCLVTEKYAKSPNCNKEVNLSMGLQKPLIPLLMEKMSWPPPGSMGPLFGEYLFIRFTARPTEEVEHFWAVAKMQELLVQMRYTVEPDPKVVTPKMCTWWKATTGEDLKPTGTVRDDSIANGSSPEVFISYQWGKQTQIRALYQQLTSLGYKCWLDINQMGGGDSLYDKIDKGIRGCGVVLSCVTTKYALSTNCRREISLADNLGKPIIPLLLESMQWPPAGPMAAPLTQLEYMDFTNDENPWSGEHFDMLLKRLGKQLGKDISQLEEKHRMKKESQKTPTKQNSKKDNSQLVSVVQAKDEEGGKVNKMEAPKKVDSRSELKIDTSQQGTSVKADDMERKEQEDTTPVVASKPAPIEEQHKEPLKTPTIQNSKKDNSQLVSVVQAKDEEGGKVSKMEAPKKVDSRSEPIEEQYILPEPDQIQYHPILPEPKKNPKPVPKQESKSCSIL